MTRCWDDTLATGIEPLDLELAELFGRAALLAFALEEGKGDEEILALLVYLEQQLIVHFAAEERLMQANAYPGLPPHRRDHQAIRAELTQVKELFFRHGPGPAVVDRLQPLVDAWLVQHVGSLDTLWAAFLAGQATRPALVAARQAAAVAPAGEAEAL